MTRRDARRAELFRRLDARCGEPPSPLHFAKSPSATPAEASQQKEEPDSPPLIVYMKQRYWKYFKCLTGMDPNTENPLLPAEDSVCQPSEKRQVIVSDKDDEQCDGGKEEQGTSQLSVPSKRRRQRSLFTIAYAVQCSSCEKWRLIPRKENYEELRAKIRTYPFECNKACEWKADLTCSEPSDVSEDDSWLWAMDIHGIPQPPPGFERLISIRGEGCTKFADVYYTAPTGKKLRSSKEVENYLKENPGYATEGVILSQFSFKIPYPARQDYVRKRSKTDQNDGSHKELIKPLPEEGETNQSVLIALGRYLNPSSSKYIVAQPIAWAAPAPPTHEELGGSSNRPLVPYIGDRPELPQQPEPPTEVMKLGNPPQPPPAS